MNEEYKIETAEFVKGIKGTDEILNDRKPHVAFIGRSNVGKSSLINSLTRKDKLVKSSSLPGKTREINFFLINDGFYFVDLPGYGFAKIKGAQKEKLRKMILWYLFSEELGGVDKKVVLIIDFKVGPTKFDLEMIHLLKESGLEYIVVVNKIDKISKGSRLKQLSKISDEINSDDLVLYSTKTNEGRDELLHRIING